MTRVLSVSVLFWLSGSSVIAATVAEFAIVAGRPLHPGLDRDLLLPPAARSPSLQVTVAPEAEQDPALVLAETKLTCWGGGP